MGLTAMTLTYSTRCEGGTNPKLMACAGIHSFHPVVTVGKSFSCKYTFHSFGGDLSQLGEVSRFLPVSSQ